MSLFLLHFIIWMEYDKYVYLIITLVRSLFGLVLYIHYFNFIHMNLINLNDLFVMELIQY